MTAGTAGENVSNERWQRIEQVFNAAIECAAANRASLLARQCGDDSDLRREVEQLLEAHERSGLVDTLAAKLEAPARWRSRIDAVEWADRRVAQYLVLAPLGAGTMGWVYKARDERLGRMVALKFLPPHLMSHAGAKNRFLLEARAAAALDHPNICTVHEIGEAPDGQLYISMPLYDGETLQARLDRGPLAAAELIHIALQVASGLRRAHQQGIVHRDVKPSNVMLLNDGTVKILDFGIAHIEDASLGASAGLTMGTLAYMSPEQARGESVDPRMDVWALGIVLYEMATGSRPFDGEDAQSLRAAIESGELAPIAARRSDAPFELDTIVRRMLAKSASQRYASMVEVEAELVGLIEREQYPAAALKRGPIGAVATSERRHAAVLVTIVSDYATLVEHHAVEQIEALMTRIRNCAVDVVRQHGGLVNHAFDEEIVALFGVPAGHEDDELRATRAAMELHRRVAQLGIQVPGERGSHIRLRTGVRSGLIVSQRLNSGPRRYAVSGGAVQSAYRLAILSARDAILVAPECQRLITPFIHTAPEDAVTLLADEGAITPHRVLGESGLQARIDAAVSQGLTTYTGRQTELAALFERFAHARDGRGQIALVVGEAGVGKSRLLHELRSRIAGADIRELGARCQSYGGTAPYQPFLDVLRQVLQLGPLRKDQSTVAAVVDRVRSIDASLVQFVPLYLHLLSMTSDEYPLPRDLRGEHLQQGVPEALAALLTRFASSTAIMMWLEDWHWSDEGSRAALHRLVEIVPSHPLFVVVTSRPAGVEQIEWSSQALQITLGALDLHASTDIVRDVLRVERVSAEFAQRLFDRTGGNPFFLEEICHALTDTGAVATVGGEGVVAGGVAALQLPETVQAVIRTRLDALDKDALEVLRVASVIGREFTHALLADVLANKLDVEPALDRLTHAGLIQRSSALPEITYRFNHVLTHEVTYESLLSHQRRSWHNVIGTALERLTPRQADGHAELLAHHFALAESWASAIDHGSRAAERARALSQFADALSMLDRVRSYIDRLPEGDDERIDRIADVMLRQERLCETLGKRGRQQQIVDELIALLAPRGTSSRLAQAYQRQGDLLTLLRRFDAADRALATALRLSREHSNSALERQALRSLGLLRWHEGRHEEALAMTERALEIDRKRCDELAVAGDLANVSTILKGMGEHQLAIAKTEEALAIPALAQAPANLSYSLQNLANIHRDAGDPQRALEVLQRANELTRIHLLPIQRSFHLMAIAHIYLQQGQIEHSLQTYQESIELSRRARYADGLVQSLREFGEVLEGLGRDEEALPRLQEAAMLFAQLEDHAGEVQTLSRIGTIADRSGKAPQAMQAWHRMRELCTKLGDIDGELHALEGIAHAARSSSGNSDEAITAAEAALSLAVTLGAQRRELTLRNILGIMHWERMEYSRALRHYELALRLSRVLSDQVHEGLMLNSLGVTLSRLHRHEEARTALEESVTLNRTTGQRLLESHALTALGDIHRMRQRHESARACYEQSLDLRRALADAAGEAGLLRRLAQLATDQE